MDTLIGSEEVVKAASVMAAGASVVALPGVRQVVTSAADIEDLHREREAELGRLLRAFSPEPKQIAALHELGVEVLPIRKRPLKPKPRGRDELVKRQRKAR